MEGRFNMSNITEFKSGAIRDVAIGKSRMELIPVELLPKEIISSLLEDYTVDNEVKKVILKHIFEVLAKLRMGDDSVVDDLIILSFSLVGKKYFDVLYDLGIHYGAGAEKYGANNFMLGQTLSHVIGSYERHLYKFINNWKDEAPHERGMLWNAINIKMIYTYYRDNKDICDMTEWYKDGSPNVEYLRKIKDGKPTGAGSYLDKQRSIKKDKVKK